MIGRSAPAVRSPFDTLWRAFLSQFFASETVTSDIQLRQTIIWVLAFLVTPGVLLAVEMYPAYQLALRFAPQAADRMFVLLTTVFVTYSGVTSGLIAVFVWDALSFDRRDGMVLGALPIRGTTIVGAKLAALGAFLLGTSFTINILSAVPFAIVIADHSGASHALRAIAAHMIATMSAAIFVFAALVTLRGVMGLFGARTSAAGATLLQFTFVSALLCFVIVALRGAGPGIRGASTVPIVDWLPTFWFVALFERTMGPVRPAFEPLWPRALWTTAVLLVSAMAISVVGYRRQLQRALVPASDPRAAGGSARVTRALAPLFGWRDPVVRATADFILLTLARGRPQQTLVAINAAIAPPILAAALSSGTVTLASLARPRTIVLWIPLVAVYWLAIGLRASMFLPSELPASWTFAVNAPDRSRSYRNGTRAAMLALLLPASGAIAMATTVFLGWGTALRHAVFVMLLTATLTEILLMTVNRVPFTHAYPPGHAKLKTRWPLYFIGFYLFAYWPARLELALLANTRLWTTWVLLLAGLAAGLVIASRTFADAWSVCHDAEPNSDEGALAVLDLSHVAHSSD